MSSTNGHAKSISEKHSAAARTNGRRGRGPITDEGRRRSSRRSLKHGLYASADSIVIEEIGETREAWERHLSKAAAQWDPNDGVEASLVEELALCTWMLQRVRRCEAAHIRLKQRRADYVALIEFSNGDRMVRPDDLRELGLLGPEPAARCRSRLLRQIRTIVNLLEQVQI